MCSFGAAEPVASAPGFAETVDRLLRRRGWTQRQLADAAQVDPAHICRLLRGARTRVTPDLAERVAQALDVAPELFGEYREWQVLQAVRTDPGLRDRLHEELAL